MQSLKRITVIIFIIMTCLFIAYVYDLKRKEDTLPPQISFIKDTISVSVHASDKELLDGVSAYDSKDGDVTSSLIIEGRSRFMGDKTKTITYAAFDSNKNVTKKTRTIAYTDYKPPSISQKKEMKLGIGQKFNLLEYVQAYDVIDGDISNKIRIAKSNLEMTKPGSYSVSFSVTNSSGDKYETTLPVEIVKQ